MRTIRSGALAGVATALCVTHAAAAGIAEHYQLATPGRLGYPDKPLSFRVANDSLDVVGDLGEWRVTRFNPESGFKTLHGLRGQNQAGEPFGIDASGRVVGYVSDQPRRKGNSMLLWRAVEWNLAGIAEALDDVVPPGNISRATAINDQGDTLVQYAAAAWEDGLTTTVLRHADGSSVVLPAGPKGLSTRGEKLTASGEVTGTFSGYMMGPSSGAFFWSPATGLRALPDVLYITGINAAGAYVGQGAYAGPSMWTPGPNGRRHHLPHLPGGVYTSCEANGINDAGIVVGDCGWFHSEGGHGSFRAVAWVPVNGVYEVVDLTPRVVGAPEDTGRFDYNIARHIDNDGRIAITRTDKHGYEGPAFLLPVE